MCLVQSNTSKLRELLRAHSLEGQRRRVEQAAAFAKHGRGLDSRHPPIRTWQDASASFRIQVARRVSCCAPWADGG